MIRVKFFPLQAHSLAFGGFEIQMLTLYENLQKHASNDIEVSKVDVWSREADFEIAHFWGLEPANLNNIFWAKKSGKKIVITVLLSYYERLVSIAYDKISKYIGMKKVQLEILSLVDAVVVVNDLQKAVGHKFFKIPNDKIYIIPNIIHENFLLESSSGSISKDYILCTGNICERKNQLSLAKACAKLGKKLVLVGKVLPGEEGYAEKLNQVVISNSNISWIKGLPENSPELIKLVKECRIFALLSESETQPISILEALAFGKDLLLSDKKFAYQSYFKKAKKVVPNNVESICNGIADLYSLEEHKKNKTSESIVDFKGENVARKYETVYKKIMEII